jgi:phosphatidylethanolamine/phosphatidyl-N-methylethanolamine N-methyltransferase
MAEPHESRVYSDFAHFYDSVFGRVFIDAEHEIIDSLNLRPGNRVLEVGIGTGISLGAYPPYIQLVGIDPSQDMLAQAAAKTRENGWRYAELRQGDACNLDFPDDSFDDVTTFHVMTVVPDPVKMMSEMVRVCKPGGRIVIVTHFAGEHPLLILYGKLITPITRLLGWRSTLRASEVFRDQRVKIERFGRFSRFSVHHVVIARKEA